MNSSYPVNMRVLCHLWLKALKESSKFSFCTNKVYSRHKIVRVEYLTYIRTYLFSKLCENTNHLSSLLILKFTNLIVSFNNLCWFYIDSLTRSTLIMYNTRNLTFQARCNWNNKSTITQGWCNILLNKSFSLCSTQDTIKCA